MAGRQRQLGSGASWCHSKAMVLGASNKQLAVILVRLQHEMCGGSGYPIYGGKLLSDEISDIVHAAAGYHTTQVLGAGYQVHGPDLGELRYPCGYVVEANTALRGDRHVDERRDHLDTGDLAHPVQIDHGFVPPDDLLLLPGSDLITHAISVETRHGRNALRGRMPIGLQDVNDLSHPASLPWGLPGTRPLVINAGSAPAAPAAVPGKEAHTGSCPLPLPLPRWTRSLPRAGRKSARRCRPQRPGTR